MLTYLVAILSWLLYNHGGCQCNLFNQHRQNFKTTNRCNVQTKCSLLWLTQSISIACLVASCLGGDHRNVSVLPEYAKQSQAYSWHKSEYNHVSGDNLAWQRQPSDKDTRTLGHCHSKIVETTSCGVSVYGRWSLKACSCDPHRYKWESM